MTPRARRFIVAAAVIAVLPLVLPEFHVTLANYIGIYSLAALGLVLLTGIGGIMSFGQAAFVGLGAYTTAVLTTRYGVAPWLTLLAALVLTGLAAFILGWITLRLSGHYVPVGTIAWGVSIYFLFANVAGLGGHSGISDIPAPGLMGVTLQTRREYYYAIWSCVVLAIVGLSNLLDSRQGRAIRALPRGTVMAESFGVDTANARILIFVIAALLAALAGWWYAHLVRFVNPTPFSLNASIEFLFMAVVGGSGHVWGAIVGATILTLLKEVLQDWLPLVLGDTGNHEAIVFGILAVLMLQWVPGGLISLGVKFRFRRKVPGDDDRFAAAGPDPKATVPMTRRPIPAAGLLLLETRALTKRFGGLTAVDGISLEIHSGEILGLIGPNGAGKSTLFDLLTGVQRPSAGEVWFNAVRIDAMPSRKIVRLGLARTFQHVHLRPEMSVLENTAIGAHLRERDGALRSALRLDRASETRLRAEAVRNLERVGLGDFLAAPAGSLPLGRQRLLEIARALCADPMLLILDEPAAGLRLQEKRDLTALLSDLRTEGMTVLIVEHDMRFVMSLADRLVVMDFGQQIASGEPDSVRMDPRVQEAYLGAAQ